MYKIAIQYCPQDKQESVKLSAVKCEGERVLGVDGFVFQFFTGEDTDQFLIDLEKLGNDIDYILWV